jgi:hypothetical protein
MRKQGVSACCLGRASAFKLATMLVHGVPKLSVNTASASKTSPAALNLTLDFGLENDRMQDSCSLSE